MTTWDPAAEVVELCSELIRIDSTNPGDGSGPGERAAAEYVAEKLSDVGIEPTIVESAPGRASVLARWGGNEGDGLLVHGHLDVVPADAADWQHDPFSGEVIDGTVWGRGAVDMKDFDATILSVVRARQRAGAVPQRPITLCFTADEEAGGTMGARWLAAEHRDWFDGCTEAIGEVGGFSVTVRGRRLYLIQTAEKGMAWARLTTSGRGGHGSMIHPDNAVVALSAAVARIGEHDWPVRLTETMRILLATVGELAGIEPTPDNVEALVEEFGPAARMVGAALRNTTSPTVLAAGAKANVVPARASAIVDGRFLPGSDDDFWDELARLAGADVEVIREIDLPGVETTWDGRLVDLMNQSLLAEDPDALVAPYLMSGGTDAKHWADLGIRCFGFAPLRLPDDLDFTAMFHGVDERVPADSLEFGARVLDRFLTEA